MCSRSQKIINLATSQFIESSSSEYSEDSDDSVKDKDYNPTYCDSDFETDESDLQSEEDDIENSARNDSEEWQTEITYDDNFIVTCTPNDIFKIPENRTTPAQIFQLFLTDELLELILNETNRYGLQNKENNQSGRIKQWEDITLVELKQFFSIIILMGIVHLPQMNLYWSKDTVFHNQFISKIMTRDRFLLILKCLHFSNSLEDTGEDKLFKLRPILVPIIESFQKYIDPGQNLIIDESMIHWRGRLKFRQYIKNKRHKYGIKMYKLCSANGYILNLRIYTGKGQDYDNTGHAGFIIKNLMEPYYDRGRILFCDNFYTNVQIGEFLAQKNTKICGTYRNNRKCYPKDLKAKKLKKGNVLGVQKKMIKVIKWMDKRPVSILSSCPEHDATLIDTGRTERKGLTNKKPQCVMDYNNAKKGVDYR